LVKVLLEEFRYYYYP